MPWLWLVLCSSSLVIWLKSVANKYGSSKRINDKLLGDPEMLAGLNFKIVHLLRGQTNSSTCTSINQSINQPINQPTNQPTNQPINQSINQSINQTSTTPELHEKGGDTSTHQ
jgi:hypothetical protein